MDIRKRLGHRIRVLRTQKGLSQEDVAGLVDRSVDAISKIERGQSLPGLETLVRLAPPLGVTLYELLQPMFQPDADHERAQIEAHLLQLARMLDKKNLNIAVAQIRVLVEYLPLHFSAGSHAQQPASL